MSVISTPSETGDTRQRILRAALHVFARRGFQAATLKEITDEAQANIAAVNYHFGSKDELIRHVLKTYVGKINAHRLHALDTCLAKPELRLEALIHAVVAPMVYLSRDTVGGRALIRLILQVRALPRHALSSVLVEQFDPVHERFITAFQRVLPHLNREDIVWRYDFARGAMMQVLCDMDPDMQRLVSLGVQRDSDQTSDDAIILQLVNFITAGLSAPPLDKRQTRLLVKQLK